MVVQMSKGENDSKVLLLLMVLQNSIIVLIVVNLAIEQRYLLESSMLSVCIGCRQKTRSRCVHSSQTPSPHWPCTSCLSTPSSSPSHYLGYSLILLQFLRTCSVALVILHSSVITYHRYTTRINVKQDYDGLFVLQLICKSCVLI